MLLKLSFIFSSNYHHLLCQAGPIHLQTRWDPADILSAVSGCVCDRSLFIRISIPSQPNKWISFSDIKLIGRVAAGCQAGQAPLSQSKCNLCGANDEELPRRDSISKRTRCAHSHFLTNISSPLQQNWIFLLCGTPFLLEACLPPNVLWKSFDRNSKTSISIWHKINTCIMCLHVLLSPFSYFLRFDFFYWVVPFNVTVPSQTMDNETKHVHKQPRRWRH